MFLFKIIRKLIAFVFLLIIVIPLYAAGNIWYTAHHLKPVKSDVIVVMGAAQFDGRPSDLLLARLQSAKKIYQDGLAPVIYTVGAGAPGDRSTEAAAGYNWLIQNGVNKKYIQAIPKGRDTLESTKAYVAQMKKAKFKSVLIVTDSYHCLRAMTMAKDLEVTATCASSETGPGSVENSKYRYLVRESAAYLAYITVGRHGISLSDRAF
jgi:vancomycin permeability regulator SanA